MKTSSPVPNDCAGIAPQLTALFDGEANEAQAHEARAHLLSCPHCSRLWLDWTQHRATLQSEPVPAPPPTLLWRVLIAYRVAALAQPARRRSALPTLSASALRELEAPLPPRLSQHILARTTRKPHAHVMLTPLDGAPAATSARRNARASKFRRVSTWAAPALALWILFLGRADFSALLPANTPDATISISPVTSQRAPEIETPATDNNGFAPVPVLSSPVWPGAKSFAPMAQSQSNAANESATENDRLIAATPPRNRSQMVAAPRVRVDDQTLSRALLLALNAGKRDISRAQTVSPNVSALPKTLVVPVVAFSPTEDAPAAPRSAVNRRNSPSASARVALVNQAAPVATARVSLVALTSPFTSIRTATSARVRPAFSEDSTRPRVTFVSASAQRQARAWPDDSATTLRVSRPVAGAPTLRNANFNGDNGPRIEDVRSAVDDFRASVAGENFGDD